MRTSVIALVLTVVAACGCSSKSKGTADPGSGTASGSGTATGTGAGTGTGTAAQHPGPGMGQTCGDADACGEGLECVKYYGIAGASGPQFKTCEKKCEADGDCPAGAKCNTIADGPGRVCRMVGT